MPGIPQTLADELLPLIFRRRRELPRTPPFAGDNAPLEDPTNILAKRHYFNGGGEGAPLGNMLAPTQDPAPPVTIPAGMQASQVAQPTETRPRQVTPPSITAPTAMPSLEATPPMDADATRMARRVETDKRGRPTPNIALQGDDQTLDYQDRLARMPEDKEGGGWWPKIRAAIAGFAAGGPVGAATALGTRALREHFDPTLGSREYKREKMAQNAPAVEQIRQGRKDQLDEASKVASTDLAKARTDALKNPRQSSRIIERKEGVYMLNPKTNKFEKVQEIPAEPGSPAGRRILKGGDGWYIVDPSDPNTATRIKGVPGPAGKDVEDVSFSNAQLHRAIGDAEAEQKKIDDGIRNVPKTIQSTDILGNPRTVANPDYTYDMTRRRQLDDQIRKWRTQLKSLKKGAAGASRESDPLGILDDEVQP